MFETMLAGFYSAFALDCLLLIAGGVALGVMFGSIPGLTASMGLILCLPLTFSMTPLNGISLLCGLFIGGISGGLIPAILMNIPGTPGSVATLFDGYPMMRKGESQKALGAAVVYSFLGTLFGIAVLSVFAPMLARFALKFTPYEYFAVSFFALALISSVSSGSMLKGFISGVLGIAIAMVGMSPVGGIQRLTGGNVDLQSGFLMVPFLVGLFAISELFHNAGAGFSKATMIQKDFRMRGIGIGIGDFVRNIRTFFVSSSVGTAIGILPGIGVSTASIMGYLAAKKTSKRQDQYGTGVVDGVVASESANNACIGGALVPLLALGIPGDTVASILLGALIMNNIQPGPLLFITQGELVYGIFTSLVIASFCMLVIVLLLMRVFIRLVQTPKNILMPIVIVMCLVGAFGVNNRAFDVWSVVMFGGLGLALRTFGFPLQPAVLGFILGPIVETNFYRALTMANGNYSEFVLRPISGAFLAAAVIFILLPVVGPVFARWRDSARPGIPKP
ncbi:tripartite tricarboxylate transporter permease [Labrenzia sp. OB1]|uniref:tripartite tricarboxylate transporter permease n=1 Tax=Labrenzia sp. OB1 TaxID=1561204 RepID=UPI0007B22653|nr:tripartite tricarboxylate transporter permease [Labrenzia sp. OB1]KZM50530.1 Tat pathway signal protein [Labrenzia sp. OB1]